MSKDPLIDRKTPTMSPVPLNDFSDVPGAKNAYLVGGCVRDGILGRRPRDYDVVVFPPMRRFAENLCRKIGGHAFDLGRPGRQIIRIISDGLTIDISPLNGSTIEADLLQRDFTVNAIAIHLASGQIVDLTGGRADLHKKTIRMVSSRAFADDPVRLIRAYRLAALLNFTIDPATLLAINTHAKLIRLVAGERIHLELFKLLAVPHAFPWLERMARDTLLFAVIPELEALKGCRRNRHHDYDAWEHTLHTFGHMETILCRYKEMLPPGTPDQVDGMDDDMPVLLKLSALLHDIGKPATRQATRTDEATFHGHERKGAEIAENIGARLKFSSRESRIVGEVIRRHLVPLQLFIMAGQNGDLPHGIPRRPVTRFFMRCGALTPPILLHALADHRGKRRLETASDADAFSGFIKELLRTYITEFQQRMIQKPLITGNDLVLEFGLTPGPAFKSILRRVEEARLSGEAVSREQGMKIVADFLIDHHRSGGIE